MRIQLATCVFAALCAAPSLSPASADGAAGKVMTVAVPGGGKPVVARTGKDGTVHLLFDSEEGPKYVKSTDGGATFSAPVALGAPAHNPSRGIVLATAQGTYVAWKEFDGEKTTVKAMQSADDGKTWSKPRVIAITADASDHPLLVSEGGQVFLSWMTKADGYRFQPIGQGT